MELGCQVLQEVRRTVQSMRKITFLMVISTIFAALVGTGVYVVIKIKKNAIPPTSRIVMNTTRTGVIKKDETWGGNIFFSSYLYF